MAWLPISDQQDPNAKPVIITPLVIFACVGLHAWAHYGSPVGFGRFVQEYALIPAEVLRRPLTIFTSVFFHAGWEHLLGNMMFLYVFGDNVEQRLGAVRYLFFFALAAFVAGGLHVMTNWGDVMPCIGASGAISGVLGAYMVLFPWRRVTVLWILPVPSVLLLGAFIAMQLHQWWGDMSDLTHVAYAAHIGGFGYGFAAGLQARGEASLRRVA